MSKSLILCNCGGSQPVDAEMISTAAGVTCSRVHEALCTAGIESAARALADGNAVIACQQERAVFEELADEIGTDRPGFVDLRDRAGWSDDAARAAPKMAALAAEALLDTPETPVLDVVSEGTCLIAGAADVILPLAAELCEILAVTALITDGGALPVDRRFDALRGSLARVRGALGGFTLRIDAAELADPVGRGAMSTLPSRDGAQSACDIVIDLTGDAPKVSAPEKREGYLRADPRDPVAVARLALAAAQLTGTFEKPLYVRLEETLCAHSRARQPGCSRCLDACPTGAITPAGDHVAIDPMICAGCGSCAALCPSTAITY